MRSNEWRRRNARWNHRRHAEHAEIWLDASSLVAGVKMLLGFDPKKDCKDKVADVSLR